MVFISVLADFGAAIENPTRKARRLPQWVQGALSLSDLLRPQESRAARKAVLSATRQALTSNDLVIRVVWPQIINYGSILAAFYSSWRRLAAFKYDVLLDRHTLSVSDAEARTDLGAALLDSSTVELRLERQALLIEFWLEKTLQSKKGPPGDISTLKAMYAPLANFVHELHLYSSSLQNQTHLIHRKRSLEAAFARGDLASHHLLLELNLHLHNFYGSLGSRFQALVDAASEAEDAGLLFSGASAFISALYGISL